MTRQGQIDSFPRICPQGLTGMLVVFADKLSEPGNRAALAFRAAVEDAGWPGVEELSTALASVFVRFDPDRLPPDDLHANLATLVAQADWTARPLPHDRKLWRIPTAYGDTAGPQLAEVAGLAGRTEAQAVAELSTARLRVMAIGFAPGQPYLGELPAAWDLPRQTALTPQVPAGALVLAVRQMVLFTAPAPTGWRQVGLTAFRCYQPDAAQPFPLRAGDEVEFPQIGMGEFESLLDAGDGMGGARFEVLP